MIVTSESSAVLPRQGEALIQSGQNSIGIGGKNTITINKAMSNKKLYGIAG